MLRGEQREDQQRVRGERNEKCARPHPVVRVGANGWLSEVQLGDHGSSSLQVQETQGECHTYLTAELAQIAEQIARRSQRASRLSCPHVDLPRRFTTAAGSNRCTTSTLVRMSFG